jgi:hypothetical protein
MHILADARLPGPNCPKGLTKTLLPPMRVLGGGGWMRRSIQVSISVILARLPSVGRRVAIRVLFAGWTRCPRRAEAERLLFVGRQEIGLECRELEGSVRVRIFRRCRNHCVCGKEIVESSLRRS